MGVLAPHAEPEGVAPQPAGVERALGDAERPQRRVVNPEAAAFGNDARQDAHENLLWEIDVGDKTKKALRLQSPHQLRAN